jgi:enoyl-CoA hydratase/carnithine racemase
MQVIRFERTGAIGHIILCSPPGNLIAVAFSEGLRQAVHEASESDVRVLLIRAEGPNFSQAGTWLTSLKGVPARFEPSSRKFTPQLAAIRLWLRANESTP